jgi:hypothetical protein
LQPIITHKDPFGFPTGIGSARDSHGKSILVSEIWTDLLKDTCRRTPCLPKMTVGFDDAGVTLVHPIF